MACITGINGEFVTSGRIDDLSMVHAALTSLLEAGNERGAIKVMAIFDNEETKQRNKTGSCIARAPQHTETYMQFTRMDR